jgi:cbb3-type cytochrome oxidase maturation protein
MTSLLVLIPAALFLGLLGLAAFLWAMRNGQFEDLEGAGHRILFDERSGPLPASSLSVVINVDAARPVAEGDKPWSTH